MKLGRLVLTAAILVQLLCVSMVVRPSEAAPQESLFELPVQLIGFPVIIMAVRLSNFVKKLAYSLNPRTYTSRSRRSTFPDIEPHMDVVEVEKRLVAEMGEKVCVYEEVCVHYADLSLGHRAKAHGLDWNHLFRDYESSAEKNRENYLLSVFLGDIVGSPSLCHQLAKRGRTCK